MNKVVVGQSVTAGQMKDFWRQVDDGSIGGDYFQDFLAFLRMWADSRYSRKNHI